MQSTDISKMLNRLYEYRTYLRGIYGPNFALEVIQDELAQRKANRSLKTKDLENLCWQVQSEAFWCFLSISPNQSFEEHYRILPENIQLSLKALGFTSYSIEELNQLKMLVGKIVEHFG